MAETPKDEATQDDIEEVEETVAEAEEGSSLDDEVTQDDIGEVADHSSLLVPFGADLELLHGGNMSFYQANKAYYEDRNYEDAIAKFQAAIEYERLQPPDSEDSVNQPKTKRLNEVIAKSMYWMGESYIKLNRIDQAVETLRQLSRRFRQHYLALAARRRIATLRPE